MGHDGACVERCDNPPNLANSSDWLDYGWDASDRYCSHYPSAPECRTTWLTYCERYPSEPYCRDPDYYQRHCYYYPNSPECDDTYLPWCDRHPDDPDCDD